MMIPGVVMTLITNLEIFLVILNANRITLRTVIFYILLIMSSPMEIIPLMRQVS